MNPESEVNTQGREYISDTKTGIERDKSTVLQTEIDEENPKISEQDALNFVIEKQEKIVTVTKELHEENEKVFDLDKLKGLVKGSVFDLKFKAYELAKNIKENISWSHIGKIAATSSLVLFAACSSVKQNVVMAVPQEMTQEAQQTENAPTPTPEVTLSPEEIREQRLNEIIEVVRENDNSFTNEELNAYLADQGEGWEEGVKKLTTQYEKFNVPFVYFFIEKNYKDSGVYLSEVPYQHSSERTMSDKNNFPTPRVISEERLGEFTEALFHHLWIIDSEGNYSIGWVNEPHKYESYVLIGQSVSSEGALRDDFYPEKGGYTFIFLTEETNWKGETEINREVFDISREDILQKDITDEEISWLWDSLKYMKEGFREFTVDKDNNIVDWNSNFKELNLKSPTTSSDTVAQEIN